MTRNGPDDATRRGTSEVDAIEGLLAYAQTRPRWGGSAVKSLSEAIARSRVLFGESPEEYSGLLARCLSTGARLLLRRGRPAEALPLAEEAVALTRSAGGAPLVASLYRLAAVLEALHRYSEAAALVAEADQLLPPD
ncbi:tetratricopeptide repeat protein [Nonomuraea sp. B5E05]|uniref:tetratricopeptide repeat protein n=1 Tax=Nonomuraea sp. B5E05 TaxID=3153569 RepID=UPI003260E5F1